MAHLGTIFNGLDSETINGVTFSSNPKFTNTNTHRIIQVYGVQALGDNTTVLNLKQVANITITNLGGEVTINVSCCSNLYNLKDGAGKGVAFEKVISGNIFSGINSHAEWYHRRASEKISH